MDMYLRWLFSQIYQGLKSVIFSFSVHVLRIIGLGFVVLSGCPGGNFSLQNVCSTLPCQHEGVCSVLADPLDVKDVNYHCLCPLRYTGDNCEKDLCSQLTCVHGSCEVYFNTQIGGLAPVCQCAPGYLGLNCALPCLHANCGRAGASCSTDYDCDMTNGYYCITANGLSTCTLVNPVGTPAVNPPAKSIACLVNEDCTGYTLGTESCIAQQCLAKNPQLIGSPCDLGDVADCPSSQTCTVKDGLPVCLRSLQSSCNADAECASGHCQEGVCLLSYFNDGLIASGYMQVCVILATGKVLCISAAGVAGAVPSPYTPPASLQDQAPVVKLSSLTLHICALLANGEVQCWGDNEQQQVEVNMPGKKALDIAAGGSHTCVLDEDGQVTCFGDNSENQGVVDLRGRVATQISAGGTHTCALLDDGQVSCWGWKSQPNLPLNLDFAGKKALQVSARNEDYTCVLLAGEEVRCFGNEKAQGAINGFYPGVKKIYTGGDHTCLLFNDGSYSCYGDNSCQSLNVTAQHTDGLNGQEMLALGLNYHYGCAVFRGGLLSCSGLSACSVAADLKFLTALLTNQLLSP